MFLNLGYGGIGILYSLLLAYLRGHISSAQTDLTEETLKNIVFIDSLPWFSWYFVVCLGILLLYFTKPLRNKLL